MPVPGVTTHTACPAMLSPGIRKDPHRMRKLSLATLVACVAMVPSASAATTKNNVHTTWVDSRTHTSYPITCNETQTINGNNRTETFTCTSDSAKAPAGTYDSPPALWNSGFEGASAQKVHVTIDNNGNLQGTASDFRPMTGTFDTTWTDSR